MNGLVYRFARWCPGALGLWIRQKFFPRYFHSCGKGVLFGRFISLVAPEKISLGDRVVLNNDVVLDAGQSKIEGTCIVIGDNVFVGTNTVLEADENGLLTVGEGANISSLCTIKANARLHIGRNCLVAAYCELGVTALDHATSQPFHQMDEHLAEDIVVGDGCWLGGSYANCSWG